MFGISKREREEKAERILSSLGSHCAKEFPYLAAATVDESTRGKQELQIKEIQQLYQHLTILDNKTSVLLRFDGLLATAFIFLIGFNRWTLMDISLAALSSHAGLLVAITSAAYCLRIVQITSKFLEYGDNLDGELRKLALTVANRASFYRVAWFLSCVSLGFMVLAFGPTVVR